VGGTGQMMLVIGALVLLSTLSVTVNGALMDSDLSMGQNGMSLQAVNLAQGIIEEAERMAFDETVIGGAPASMPGGFTAADSSSLGPELGEAYPDGFDDLDDFNGFNHAFTIGGQSYLVKATVGYVDPDDAAHMAPPVQGAPPAWTTRYATSPTFVKEIEVRVSSNAIPIEICLNHMFAYQP
jgi:hypothetical protein